MMTHGPTSTSAGQERASPYNLSLRLTHHRHPKNTKCNTFQQIYGNELNSENFRQERKENQHVTDVKGVMEGNVTRNETISTVVSDDLLLVEEHIRPLIKEELRLTIQSKRAARGLPETIELEYKKPQQEDISLETLLKREKRRERNKVAAAKCRFKKKIVSEKLQEESENLASANLKLRRDIERLEDEKQKLNYILDIHRATCLSPDLYNELPIQSENKRDELLTHVSSNDQFLDIETVRSWALSSKRSSSSLEDLVNIPMSGNLSNQRTLRQTC